MSDPVAPWDGDCELNEAVVRVVVRAQFPELEPWEVRFLTQGWDSQVHLVNGEWLFRMPKRAEVVPRLRVERALLPLLDEALPVDVPRFAWHGVPSERYPHPFSGYRVLRGDLGDAIPRREIATPACARQLGELLRRVHDFPVERARAVGVPDVRPDADPVARLQSALDENASGVEAALGPRRWAAFRPVLERDPPESTLGPRFRHADLDLKHLLVDPHTRAITGVIDWGDADLGDPALDLAAFQMRCGDDFTARAIAAYEPGEGAAFHERVRGLAKRLAVLWLAESLRMDPESTPRFLRGFDRIYGTDGG